MLQSEYADIRAYLIESLFGFTRPWKVLDYLVSASIFELPDCILIAPPVFSGDGRREPVVGKPWR